MTGNAKKMEELGYFDLSGMTAMEVGRLDKNTGAPVKYNGLIRNNWEIYTGKCGEIVGKQHEPDSSFPYRLVMANGGFLEIPKLVYRALTYPEVTA